MARKKKEVGPVVREGDIVILNTEDGSVLGVGVVERIKPMHGSDQDMIWVPGFAAHHPDLVDRVGSPSELIGKVRVLGSDLTKKESEAESLKKELSLAKDRLDQAMKAMDKTTSMLFIVDGMEMIDARSMIKWIKDARARFSLSAIREIGHRPTPPKSDKKSEE